MTAPAFLITSPKLPSGTVGGGWKNARPRSFLSLARIILRANFSWATSRWWPDVDGERAQVILGETF
jgi:hypothetical protein